MRAEDERILAGGGRSRRRHDDFDELLNLLLDLDYLGLDDFYLLFDLDDDRLLYDLRRRGCGGAACQCSREGYQGEQDEPLTT